ncbi:MAG: glycosyltransferase, partial [Jannaschia sp.]
LGGTTLFFRRKALERLGGWDAHNVTEDADLGVRLARRGLRTEILNTTTLEEANASPVAWVKQRSRWMKGYILTWAVHSRHPVQLWRDLGAKRFWGFHLQFLGAILNAVLMPFLWSTVVLAFGVWHPVLTFVPGGNALPLAILFATMTVLNMGLAMVGCSAPHHRRLRRWVPTLEVYFPLATLAVAKALTEIVLRPFHWDKTVHGAFGGDDSATEIDTLHNGLSILHPRR